MPKAHLISQFFKNTKTFDAVVQKVKFLSAGDGACSASLIVEKEHSNPIGILHGGFSATVIDIVSSAALLTHNFGEVPSVSVNLNITSDKIYFISDKFSVLHKGQGNYTRMPKKHLIVNFLKNYAGFNHIAKKVNYVSADKGSIVATLKIEQEHLNAFGTLHAGCSGALIDIISSIGLMTHDNNRGRDSVSVIISLKFLRGANIGDEIIITSNTLRTGKKLAFLEAEIRKKDTNALLVRADHTKCFI